MSFVYLFLSCQDRVEAQKISDALLSKKLIACAKIINSVESSFLWQGKVDKTSEVLLLMESHESRCPAIEEVVKQLHSYETITLSAVPMVYIATETRKWLQGSLELL